MNVLEYSYLALLVLMSAATGLIGLFIVARLVEPRGIKVLLKRIAGRA